MFTDISMMNVFTGASEILVSRANSTDYSNITFNLNASQILYTTRYPDMDQRMRQIMLYDMETGEEIPLPLFGHSPQWVNGGR